MPVNWMDVADLSFNTLLLLERVQLGWLPGWLDEEKLAVALRANPHVEWYMRHKNPALNQWLDRVMIGAGARNLQAEVQAECFRLLLAHDYRWGSFVEPEEGTKRKYWKELPGG